MATGYLSGRQRRHYTFVTVRSYFPTRHFTPPRHKKFHFKTRSLVITKFSLFWWFILARKVIASIKRFNIQAINFKNSAEHERLIWRLTGTQLPKSKRGNYLILHNLLEKLQMFKGHWSLQFLDYLNLRNGISDSYIFMRNLFLWWKRSDDFKQSLLGTIWR